MAEILLVEPAEPVSESVIEANKSRMDPLSTNKLVSTSAQIKDKINAKLSPEGRYLYNDQFSDITICDANGKNLVNDEYYSFIAKDNDKLYITKNNPDTDVLEFSIPEQKIIKEELEIVPNEVAVPVQEAIVSETEPVAENVNEGFDVSNVAPVELSNVYNAEIPNIEVTPVQNEVNNFSIDDKVNSFSFDTVNEETPNEEINQETLGDTFSEADFEKSLESIKADKKDMQEVMNDGMTFLSQYDTKEDGTDYEDPFANYQGVHIDDIKYDDDNNEFDSTYVAEDEAKTAKEFVEAFEALREENTAKNRELSEARSIIEKQRSSSEKDKNEIRSLKQKNELAVSTIRDLRDTVTKQEAEIAKYKDTVDILKGKADGLKYELAEKDHEIARLNSRVEGYDYIKTALERYKTEKDYGNLYNNDENSYYKVA